MEKSLFKPFLTVLGLMIVAVLALAFTVGVKLDFKPGVQLELPSELKGWVGNELRFCHNPTECAEGYKEASFYLRDLENPDKCPQCGEELYSMSRSEYEALPKDTEFIKSAYTNDTGHRVFVSIVLSGTARDSIHRPQRCLVAQGNSLEGEYTLEVPFEGRDSLKVRVIKASRRITLPDGKPSVYQSYYAYWFVGQDKETPFHLERMFWLAWDRVVHSKAHRWAYIAVSGARDEGTVYEDEIKEVVQKMYPSILTPELREKVYKH